MRKQLRFSGSGVQGVITAVADWGETEDDCINYLVIAREYPRAEYDSTVGCYKVDDYWHPNDEDGIIWNDPTIGIVWPEVRKAADGMYRLTDGTELIFSEKDRHWSGLQTSEGN